MKLKPPPKNKWHRPSTKGLQARANREYQVGLHDRPDQYRPAPVYESVKDEVPDNSPNSIKIYLDDERPCPPGWTLCKTFWQFKEMLERDKEFLDQVSHISLDWYLGPRDQVTGHEAVGVLGQMIFNGDCDDQPYMPNLKVVSFHSSDLNEAKKMRRSLEEILEFSHRDNIRLRIGTPSL